MVFLLNTLDKILELKLKKGLTDTKFSELTGLNKAVLFDWRSGKTKSYMKHLPKIAEVLGVSVDYLLQPLDEIILPDDQIPNTDNLLIINNRNGKTIRKQLTPEQAERLQKLLEAGMPEIMENEAPDK